MNVRILCIALMTCFAATAQAERYTYEIAGYFDTKTEGADPATHFPSSFRPGDYFTGWVVYDTYRVWVSEDGWSYPAPVRSLYLENSAGDSIISIENFSALGSAGFPGFDDVGFSTQARRDDD